MKTCTAFMGHRRFAMGPIQEVALAAKKALDSGGGSGVWIFDDATGSLIDVDPRGTDPEVLARLAERVAPDPPTRDLEPPDAETGPRGRGRPKLGVVAREVTLLPRHWDWLSAQPGGASVALRKLVEGARRASGDRDRIRAAQEAAYRFMSSIGGDLPGFEEASRALFAYDRRSFGDRIAAWPADVRDYAIKLAFADLEPAATGK
jgi:uncharacterized protein